MIKGQYRGLLAALIVLILLSAMSVVAAAQEAPAEEVINETALDPTPPQSDALDELLDAVMDDILQEGDDLEPYDQLKACYDYLTDNMRYGSHMSYINTRVDDGVTCNDIYNSYGEVEGFGAVALTANTGMCNTYASAFILMARKIGLDADLAKGYTKSAGGGYAYHEWAEITVDGETYIFDPQLDQSLVRSGMPEYSVFAKTYGEIASRYVKE